jgi:DHA2 family methylenomycin A resistance protein-like MFS transporter
MRSIGGLIATSFGFAVVQLDVSVVNVAIRPIGHDLGAGVSALQWIVDAYTIAFAALILSAGALGDRVGARRVFVVGFAVFVLASIACAIAPTLAVLIAARAVQGVGAAILVPCSLSLLTHEYREPHDRARAIGIWAAGGSVALSVGPIVGGALIAGLGWRAIFLINVPIGAIGIVLAILSTTETSRTPRRLDVPGQVLAIVALGVLSAGIIERGRGGIGWIPATTGIAAGLALIAVFIAVERRSATPMLPVPLFRSRTFSAASAIGLLVNVTFYGLIFVLSLFFQRSQDLSPLRTGVAFVPLTLAVLATNLTAGRIVGRIGTRAAVLLGAGLMLAGLAGLVAITPHAAYATIAAPLIALGAGLGVIVPAITAAQLGAAAPERSGVASGTLNAARQTGSVIGVALLGSLAGGTDLAAGLRIDVVIGLALTIAIAFAAIALHGRSRSAVRHG